MEKQGGVCWVCEADGFESVCVCCGKDVVCEWQLVRGACCDARSVLCG